MVATNDTNNTAYGDAPIEQRPRPTNPLLLQLTYGITRDNIQRRFEDLVKQLVCDYLDECEGLTINNIERIIDGDNDIIEELLNGLIRVVYADECDDVEMADGTMTWGIGDYLTDIIGNRDESPLYFIDDNALDEIPIFIGTTKSVIMGHQYTHPINRCKLCMLIEYVCSIIYWFGRPYLLEWCRDQLQIRLIENHNEHTTEDDEIIEIRDGEITDDE